ncbi:hypothetical protein BCR42DRAFT_141799 [Absidia repens]|uniref:PHD-type domain-containing protein n=1 Tax=Absidia repens TaxID=90262 RepID=A0A1X2I3M8_9FUNG|nr:hypothetical protein BCR42DRAFT_141799 [Absidia repens]
MANDEDTCAVCHTDLPKPKNPIIFCDGTDCNIAVHKRCYGVGSVPKGDWFCQRCECKLKKKPTNVICCSVQTGAFKYTVVPGGFMHVVCAMWNKAIDHTSEIYAVDKQDLNVNECDICHETTGLCIKCQHHDCSSRYHVTCAIDSGHLTPASSVPDKFKFYCQSHQPVTSNRRTSTSKSASAKSSTMKKRRRGNQYITSDDDGDDDDVSEAGEDDEDDDDHNNMSGGDPSKDDDEEMGDDDDDDDDDDDADDGDEEHDDEDSDDDMGLTPRKRNKKKSATSSTLSNKRRATGASPTATQRKGPLKLFLDDQNSSDDDMGTTSNSTSIKSKGPTNRHHQDSLDMDVKKEPSPTTSSAANSAGGVLSLPERLKAKRNKMEISKPNPPSPMLKKSSVASSNNNPSLALDLNKPSGSSGSGNSGGTYATSNTSNTISSLASIPKPATSTTSKSGIPTFSSSGPTGSATLHTESAHSISSSTPLAPTSSPSLTPAISSSSTSQPSHMNGLAKQKLPNKTHLTTSSPKSNFNGINNGNNNPRSGNTASLSPSMSSNASLSSIQSNKAKPPGISNNNTSNSISSNSNSSNNINNKPSNTTKVKDLDEIQNDIRAQRRPNSNTSMDINNGNNGLHRNSIIMDRKNSQQQSGMDMMQLNMMKSTILEAVESAMAARSAAAPPPIPVPDLATIQQLQSKLQIADREIQRINAELRRASEFKKNVADVFEGLNIQLPGTSRPLPPGKMQTHVEEYINDIKNVLLRSGPVADKTRDRVANFVEETIKDDAF